MPEFGTKPDVWVKHAFLSPVIFLIRSGKKCEIITFCRILTIFGNDIISESLLQWVKDAKSSHEAE